MRSLSFAILSKLKPDAIGYSGTKDKRAVTTQYCTVYRKKPADFGRINGYKFPPFIRVGDFKYVDEPARLGRLKGNRFEILLRNITVSEKVVEAACESMKASGFINYYGLQRFGRGGSRSHDIGKAIFKSDWKACIDMLFTPQSADKAELKAAKLLYAEGNLQEAVNSMPSQMQAEKYVLKRLQVNSLDYLSAFNSLPKNNRLICAHAYQSYIWNMVATERIKQYGLQCVEGDLVATTSSSSNCEGAAEMAVETVLDDTDFVEFVEEDLDNIKEVHLMVFQLKKATTSRAL